MSENLQHVQRETVVIAGPVSMWDLANNSHTAVACPEPKVYSRFRLIAKCANGARSETRRHMNNRVRLQLKKLLKSLLSKFLFDARVRITEKFCSVTCN